MLPRIPNELARISQEKIERFYNLPGSRCPNVKLRRTQSEHIFSGLPQIPDIRRSRSRLPHAARLTAPAFEPILRLVRLNPEAPTEFKAGQHLSGRHLMTTPQVDLGRHELSAIVRWEEQTPWICEIRLFGSRAKSTARSDSDIDLAVTVTSNERGNTAFGVFCARADQWKRQLGEKTGRPV
jgi:predicted nucleotidyltransferase